VARGRSVPSRSPRICGEHDAAGPETQSPATRDRQARHLPARGLHWRKSGGTGDRVSRPLDRGRGSGDAYPIAGPATNRASYSGLDKREADRRRIVSWGLRGEVQGRAQGGASRSGDQHLHPSGHSEKWERTDARGRLRPCEKPAMRGTPVGTNAADRRHDTARRRSGHQYGVHRSDHPEEIGEPRQSLRTHPITAPGEPISRGQTPWASPQGHRHALSTPWNQFPAMPR
jgi:hypothetical protein